MNEPRTRTGPRPGLRPLLVLAALSLHAVGQETAAPAPSPERVAVPKELVVQDDGDSFSIRWPDGPAEAVRILGIDTPEVQHLDHDLPYPQPFGEEARGFLRGCVAAATRLELLRSGQKDPYGRTLGYLLLDDRNYSVLVIQARLAVETVSHFGDNGLPEPAKACLEAAKAAGPVPFEPPHIYRQRMRKVAAWMKAQGTYPKTTRDR